MYGNLKGRSVIASLIMWRTRRLLLYEICQPHCAGVVHHDYKIAATYYTFVQSFRGPKPHLNHKQLQSVLPGHITLPGFLSTAAHGLVDTAVESKSTKHCLRHIASLGGYNEQDVGTCSHNHRPINSVVRDDEMSESAVAL